MGLFPRWFHQERTNSTSVGAVFFNGVPVRIPFILQGKGDGTVGSHVAGLIGEVAAIPFSVCRRDREGVAYNKVIELDAQ